MAMSVSLLVYHFGSDLNVSTMTFCVDIHGAQRTYPAGIGDSLILSLVPPAG